MCDKREERYCKQCKKTWKPSWPGGFKFGAYETEDCPNCIPEHLMKAEPSESCLSESEG